MRFDNSQECTKGELDLFSVPPTQTSIESAAWYTVNAKQNLQSTIEFSVSTSGNNYLDLSKTELFLDVEIKKLSDGLNPVYIPFNDTKIAPVNNFLHSLFDQIEIKFNNEPVENTNKLYSYRAYIENLLSYNKEAKDTLLKTEGFYKDDAYNFENFMIEDEPDTIKTSQVTMEPDWYSAQWISSIYPGKKANKGFVSRRKMFVLNKAQLRGKLHCDAFNIKRYLLNNVTIDIILTRNDKKFTLMGEDGNYEIIISNPQLKIRYAQISPQVRLAHETALTKSNAKYPIDRVVMKSSTIAKLTETVDLSISSGLLPYQVIIGLVDHDSYNGILNKNPYNFKNYGLQSIELTSGCKNLPYNNALKSNFENNHFLETYYTLFQGINKYEGIDLDLDDFRGGNALYVFNLKPDLCDDEQFNLLEQGGVNVTMKFDKKVADTGVAITAVILLKYQNIIEFTKDRQVLFDYKI